MFKSTILSLFILIATPLIGATDDGGCHQDNCQRAVQRTWQGPAVYAQHLADCGSNLACFSTPAAAVVTATSTVTTGTLTVTVAKITSVSTPIPSVLTCGNKLPDYVTDQCAGSFKSYSNACVCASVTATTNVAATPTLTAVVTSTVPATIVYV